MTHEQTPIGRVFLSYRREDAADVDRLQRRLASAGIPVWRDTADLWPGQDWRLVIRRAIAEDALAFVVCFSTKNTSQGPSRQIEELNLAADQLRQRPADEPWLIPVRLDDCTLPHVDLGGNRTLESIQGCDFFGPEAEANADRLVSTVQRIFWHPSGDSTPLQTSDPVQSPETRTVPSVRTLPRAAVGAVGGLAAAVTAAAVVLALIAHSPSKKPPVVQGSRSATGSQSPTTSPVPSSGGLLLRRGLLIEKANVAVNLDSKSPDWGAHGGSWDNIRNFEWGGGLGFGNAGGPYNVVTFRPGSAASYQGCLDGKRYGNPEIRTGAEFCIWTSEGNLALLEVRNVSYGGNGELSMYVRVWFPGSS